MDFIDDIKNETLIICNRCDKEQLLKRSKLINLKVMTLSEFIKNYCFTYDESAILHIMNKYSVKYDIAKEYIDNLYYILNKRYDIKKLDFLVEVKKELDDNNFLQYNDNFREYIKNIPIIVYGIDLGKYELELLKNINYQYIEKKYEEYEHIVYEFDSLEDEVYYIANKICQLIDNGVDPKSIKLTNVDSNYNNTLIRIFSQFGLKVGIEFTSKLSSFGYVKDFIKNLKNMALEDAFNKLDNKNVLYDEVTKIVNNYLEYDNIDLIIYKLENTTINSDKYDNEIEIIDLINYNSNDHEYIFLLGFNDGIIPNSFKDIEYITDNIRNFVYMDTTKEKNVVLRKNILRAIKNTKNLFITYKLKDSKKTFYPSSLIQFFNVERISVCDNVSYSEKYDKIRLAGYIDDYVKYGYVDKLLSKYYNNYKINYNKYKNEYTKISRVMDHLSLSYSSMQLYNKCAFRYYLSNILKLDIYEKNFSSVIGSVVHYVMENCLKNHDDEIDKYVDEYLKDIELSKKEQFFLKKYKLSIRELLNEIKKENEYSSYKDALYEKKVEIDYGNNIKFVGIIDKVLYKEENDRTYITLIDYKTGHDDISLGFLKYGLNLQLPIYLYLSDYLNLRNIVFSGFYLQKFNITDKDYRLVGYSNSDPNILSILDDNYQNSQIIKGMRVLKDGTFSKNTKVLSNDEIGKIKEITKTKIDEVIDNIKNNKFDINPKIFKDKLLGCEYCKFKDICFVKRKNYVEIKKEEFGGSEDGMDE